MQDASLLLIVAVLLPPAALDILGEVVEERMVSTPFGEVGPVARRCLDESISLWIQPYTGSASRTDPRATIFAAKSLGVRRVMNWDRVVAVNLALRRGQTALAGDYVDWTRNLPTTMANALGPQAVRPDRSLPMIPCCSHIAAAIQSEVPTLSPVVYLGVDGNRRETVAEARLFRAWQVDVIGYNLMPEVVLANEGGLCYAGIVTVSDLSADRPPAPARGEVRESLGQVTNALPNILRRTAQPSMCTCRGNPN